MKTCCILLSLLAVALSVPLEGTKSTEDTHYEDHSDFINDETHREFGLPNKYDDATFIKDVTSLSEETAQIPLEFEDAKNHNDEEDTDVIPDAENVEDNVLTEMDSEILNETEELEADDQEDLSEIEDTPSSESDETSDDTPLQESESSEDIPDDATNDELSNGTDESLKNDDELTDNEDESKDEEYYELPEDDKTDDAALSQESPLPNDELLSEDSKKRKTADQDVGYDEPSYENLFL